MGAHLIEEDLDQLGGFGVQFDHHIEDEKAGQDAVTLGDMATEGIPARFFPTDEGIGFEHLWSNVFEANASFMDGNIVDFAQLVEHPGGGDGLDDRATLATHLEHVISKQTVDAQLIDELAVLIADTDPVSVAIVDQQDIGIVIDGGLQADIDVGGDRLGPLHLREEGIALGVNLDHLGSATLEQSREPACPVAPHRIDHHFQACIADRLEIEHRLDEFDIRRGGIETNDQALFLGFVYRQPHDIVFGFGNQAFDFLESLRSDSPPAFVPHLETVIRIRIVRSGHIDRANRLFLYNGIGNHRRGRRPVGQINVQSIARQHLGNSRSEKFTLVTAIVPNDNPLIVMILLQ